MKNNSINIFLISVLTFICTGNIIADKYSVKNIPAELLDKANAVIRNYSIIFEIEDHQNAVQKVTLSVTIFNKNEQHYGELQLWYNKFRKISKIEGIIFDENGIEIRELRSKEIKDYSYIKNYSLYEDSRTKYAELYYDKFPYTVEYTFEYTYEGYISWPSWYSRYYKDAVEYTSFEVITPSNFELRYWSNKIFKPVIKTEKRKKIYRWEEEKLSRLPNEISNEDIEDYSIIIRIAPDDFEIEGYKGNMSTWENFGYWYYDLSKGKNVLPDLSVKEIHDMANQYESIKEKAEALYEFMQNRTRYVSIQLGIGGWKPYDAAYVDKNGYGDCKALSNYMIAILNEAGISAYPVLINNGNYKNSLITEFPNNQFNHVIVCIPMEYDSLWLECTSQSKPPGNIGWSNENRYALMVTPSGGTLVKTPSSFAKNNLKQKNILVKLKSNGKAEADVTLNWFGNQHDYVLPVANNSNALEQQKWIRNLLEVPDIQLSNYSFINENKNLNEISLQLNLTLARYGSVSGSRIFFNPNLMERKASVPPDMTERISPVNFRYPFRDIDTIRYIIPDNYKTETLPKEVNLEVSFGRFLSKTIAEKENIILFIRDFVINDYTIPAENYTEYQKFMAEIVKADKQQVVIVKK